MISPMAMTLFVMTGIFLFIIIAVVISMYNSLIVLKQNINKAWANINVLLKQRHDELPNLIATVKGYMRHEKNLLETISKLRTQMFSTQSISKKAAINNEIELALKTIFAVAENYPNLRANENFLKLQQRITGLENEIADRREFYNDSVTLYNTRMQQIPWNIMANMMHLQQIELFKATEEEKQLIKTEF